MVAAVASGSQGATAAGAGLCALPLRWMRFSGTSCSSQLAPTPPAESGHRSFCFSLWPRSQLARWCVLFQAGSLETTLRGLNGHPERFDATTGGAATKMLCQATDRRIALSCQLARPKEGERGLCRYRLGAVDQRGLQWAAIETRPERRAFAFSKSILANSYQRMTCPRQADVEQYHAILVQVSWT